MTEGSDPGRQALLRAVGAFIGCVALIGGAVAVLLSFAAMIVVSQADTTTTDYTTSQVSGILVLALLGIVPGVLILRSVRRNQFREAGFWTVLSLGIYGGWAGLLLSS